MLSELIVHLKYDGLGCSPDGLIHDDGGTESKCPFNEAIYVRTWLEGMHEEHMPQVQGCRFVTGRKCWDFLSSDSRRNEECRLYVETIHRDEEYVANMHRELGQFNLELNRMVDEVVDKARTQAHRLGA